MSFTEAEKRQWHADRKAGRVSDSEDHATTVAVCSHCGISLTEGDGNSDFPLCPACDD